MLFFIFQAQRVLLSLVAMMSSLFSFSLIYRLANKDKTGGLFMYLAHFRVNYNIYKLT